VYGNLPNPKESEVHQMDQETISPSRVIDAAALLFGVIEHKDMRAAIASLAAMLILPDLDWPLDCDDPAVKLAEATIRDQMNSWL
jgi:hypothetical protein